MSLHEPRSSLTSSVPLASLSPPSLERPARTYHPPQVHDLGSLEQVQGGWRVAVRDGPRTFTWFAR
jgi:hypothetical protein